MVDFDFGANWADFIKQNFSQERLAAAQKKLLTSLQLESLENMSFLDIGSGSGIHSYAAWQAGAKQIVSFDYNPKAVDTTKYLWTLAGKPDNWKILQGSVLDNNFMQALGKFDIVYSWGVLHHTGDMWQAIRNARIPLNNNGVYFIALYSYTSYESRALGTKISPETWLKIKKTYNSASPRLKKTMEYLYFFGFLVFPIFLSPANLKNNLKSISNKLKNYGDSRGMEIWTDIRDWLGGWPMEFIKEKECMDFCHHELGLEIVQLNTGEGNTEFIFRPQGSTNYWDSILANKSKIVINPLKMQLVKKNMWKLPLPEFQHMACCNEAPRHSHLTVFENGLPLAYNYADHNAITKLGHGRYSHWQDSLFFSSSDNSNPTTNKREYTLVY